MPNHDGMTLVLSGNVYAPYGVSMHRDQAFLDLIEVLRSSDGAISNLECVIYEDELWPAFGSGMGAAGSYMTASASMIDELKFMGIKAVYAANNHAADFGELGILSTMKHLEKGGIAFAGIGASLTDASMPCYFETQFGRVAVIAASDWGPQYEMGITAPWPAGYMPSDEVPPFKSRPGINLLRYDGVFHVDQASFDQLHKISEALDWEKGKVNRREGSQRTQPLVGPTNLGWEKDTDNEFFFMGRRFALGDTFGISTFAYQEDVDRIYRHVREARRQADVVVMALHDVSHSMGVHEYVQVVGRGAIDMGADIFHYHGGAYRGIEIYKQRPLFYGQPSLYMENERLTKVPSEQMRRMGFGPENTPSDLLEGRIGNRARAFEGGGGARLEFSTGGSAINTVRFDGQGEPTEIRIQPIELMSGYPRIAPAESETFNRILKRAVDRSKPFGTTVEIRDGAGVVDIN